jgi:AraC-like DNA-binding protein
MFKPPSLTAEATVNGPRSRCWVLDQRDCPELAVLHMARMGIDQAHAPYRRVRLRPAGSFLLASLEGEGRVLLEGRWQKIGPGTMCLAPPRVLNALVASAERPWVFAWVRYDEPSWVSPLVGAASPLRVRAGAEEFGQVLRGLRREWDSERDAAQIHHWVSLLHGLALRAARPWHSSSRIGKLWEIVANDLAQDWKLNSLAARCNLSAEHLRRLCLREFGRTPMEHVTYMRICRAQGLLETTDHKLEHIATSVGYHSSDVFTRAFGRYVGVPPSHYRERR